MQAIGGLLNQFESIANCAAEHVFIHCIHPLSSFFSNFMKTIVVSFCIFFVFRFGLHFNCISKMSLSEQLSLGLTWQRDIKSSYLMILMILTWCHGRVVHQDVKRWKSSSIERILSAFGKHVHLNDCFCSDITISAKLNHWKWRFLVLWF